MFLVILDRTQNTLKSNSGILKCLTKPWSYTKFFFLNFEFWGQERNIRGFFLLNHAGRIYTYSKNIQFLIKNQLNIRHLIFIPLFKDFHSLRVVKLKNVIPKLLSDLPTVVVQESKVILNKTKANLSKLLLNHSKY